MRAQKPLWHEGLILTPQHFQQQEQWLRFTHRQLAELALAEPWGLLGVDVDEEALHANRFKLNRLVLRLPDGTPIDTSVVDALPPARDLSRDIRPDVHIVLVFVALPLLLAEGDNCRFDDAPLPRPRRYVREFAEIIDQNGRGVEELSVERHALRLAFEFESMNDSVVCPVARLKRGVHGRFQLDDTYVPPCLFLSAHAKHLDRVQRLADILLAKATSLAARRGQRIEQVAEFGVADVSLFWLLHCVHTHWPRLAFLASHPQQSPERLYAVLSELAGALMTFSTGTALSAIPLYEHTRQDEIFNRLDSLIRDLLDTVIPSRVIPIGLAKRSATSWMGQFNDERLLKDVDYYLSVNASLPALQLLELIPRLCKIGAPDDVEHIVNSALTGVPLKAVQRVPAAIPVRLENQYFALDTADPAHARMLAARACQIYLPASVPEASLELFAVLSS
ncbi:type VI secretion system baseplate subunit TssK [Dyella flava]|uniref:Type VI secretion system baseplate subunit TssK n=1 Tax=Dyella flava TaxID=1920170 RepID=A0ABS2K4Y3_9GAMM|nr:type VI secretion system baseplate subunit TssK [Dyella flava]MBM7125863.1 type VI secretion system baseplate subunit TssK [Dyella flava]GLQ48619.1 type VI secretion system-associated protein [Dyella flava]